MTELVFQETVPIQIGEGESLVLTLMARPAVSAPTPTATPTVTTPTVATPTAGVYFQLSFEDAADTLRPRSIALLGGGDPLLVFIGGDGRGRFEDAPPGLYSALPILSDFFADPGSLYEAVSGNKSGFQTAYRSFSIPRGTTKRTSDLLKDDVRINDGDRFRVRRRIIRFDSDGTSRGTDEIAEVSLLSRKGVPLDPPETLVMLIVLDGTPRAKEVF